MTTLTHRGYNIQRTGKTYVAKPADGDQLEFSSVHMQRVLGAIDALWLTASQIIKSGTEADELVSPRWLRDWLRNPTSTIDLDLAYKCGAC